MYEIRSVENTELVELCSCWCYQSFKFVTMYGMNNITVYMGLCISDQD